MTTTDLELFTPVHSIEQARTDSYIHIGDDQWARRCSHCQEVVTGEGTGGAASAMALHVTGQHGTSVARLSRRKQVHRGQAGTLVVGRDTHGRSVRVFTPDGGFPADLIVANIKAGRGSFDIGGDV